LPELQTHSTSCGEDRPLVADCTTPRLVLDRLLEDAKLTRDDLSPVESIERSESDLALAISAGRADVGLGIEAAARQYQLAFVPLVEERFDLLVLRKAWFDPPFQRLFAFCRAAAFAERAGVLVLLNRKPESVGRI
jgi:molybdate-binding protein